MRIPGSDRPQHQALDEAAAELTFCPVCNGCLRVDDTAYWDLRVVRAKMCATHGFFFIKWNPKSKKVTVAWIADRYLPDLK